MAGEGRVLELAGGSLKVVFSHGGEEHVVQRLDSAEHADLVLDMMARCCEQRDVALADLVEFLLLDRAPQTATAADLQGKLPLHHATWRGHTATCQLLLDRAPQTAVVPDSEGKTPLQLALLALPHHYCNYGDYEFDGDEYDVDYEDEHDDSFGRHDYEYEYDDSAHNAELEYYRSLNSLKYDYNWPCFDAARCFVAAGPAAAVLAALPAVPEALPLFADFFIARSTHLTCEEWTAAWSAVPAPCPGLMRALPAVLAHSAEQARHLVQHLPPADVKRLRTAALCLARAQYRRGIFLPNPVVWKILALIDA
ncbi:hypothetical protein D9Q98_003291 [Chlorella vulgaris]|uniref:Uncharacterized protein n=1 Tax=Chlorella vulgaris TaxID=3077 RepID=A0A9D4TSR9_CHLVU|nr:hypothetical protein D9Q98_003291 [Chlorella vulgaris]